MLSDKQRCVAHAKDETKGYSEANKINHDKKKEIEKEKRAMLGVN